MEKATAPHSRTLAWKIPWTEEPGRLQSMGSLWVGHNWATSLSLFTFMHWRRKWQPTPVFLPGESQGQGSLVGLCLWGHTESDTTEVTQQQQQQHLTQNNIFQDSVVRLYICISKWAYTRDSLQEKIRTYQVSSFSPRILKQTHTEQLVVFSLFWVWGMLFHNCNWKFCISL